MGLSKDERGTLMKFFGEAVYLSKEAKAGYKDPTKTYYNALLMSGTETINVGVEKDCFFETLECIPQFTECKVQLEYNPQFRILTLVDITPIDE